MLASRSRGWHHIHMSAEYAFKPTAQEEMATTGLVAVEGLVEAEADRATGTVGDPYVLEAQRSPDDRSVGQDEENYVSTDLVKEYLKQIGKVALLTAEQEVELAKRIEAGVLASEKLEVEANLDPQLRKELEWIKGDGKRAMDHMLEANLRLVVSLAKRYTDRGLPLLDLIQEGNIGLTRAVQKFDYQKGYKFSTYATWWIRQGITRALADQSRTIRVPVHMHDVIIKVTNVQRAMSQSLGREPTPEELASELGMAPEAVIEVQGYSHDPISLDMGLDNNGVGRGQTERSLGDMVEDVDAANPADAAMVTLRNEEIRRILELLDEREATSIRMRFGLDDGVPKTLAEIGKTLGLTRERIRQIEAKALEKLRANQEQLRIYLEDN